MKGNSYRKLYRMYIFRGFQTKGSARKARYQKREDRRKARREMKDDGP